MIDTILTKIEGLIKWLLPLIFSGLKTMIFTTIFFYMNILIKISFSFTIKLIDSCLGAKLEEFLISGLAGWLLSTTNVPEAIHIILSAYVTRTLLGFIPFSGK